jgi:parvulin-like peptidyl-prolyl isomerase
MSKKKDEVKKVETKKVETIVEKKVEEVKKNDEKAMVKKVKRANNDKVIIFSIIASVIVIALGIFGYYFYETNMKPVATFDGGTLTTAEYTVYYKTFAPMLEYYGYEAKDIPDQIAKKAGVDKIILKIAKEAGVTLSDEDRAKVEETFSNKETLAQFEAQGIDIAKLKELYFSDYIINAYIEQQKKDAKDEDVIAYIKSVSGETSDMNEYNTRHILFKLTDDTGASLSEEKQAEVKAKAEAILAKAIAGEDFETLAKENSEDTGTKEDGGKFAVYMNDKVMKEYSEATKNLKAGEITTTLVKTDAGYHIIKLESVVENGRKNNDTEREEFVNVEINKLNETKNLKINEEVLTKLVESITGKKAEDTKTTENTDQTTTDTTNTEGTTTENTTQAQ